MMTGMALGVSEGDIEAVCDFLAGGFEELVVDGAGNGVPIQSKLLGEIGHT